MKTVAWIRKEDGIHYIITMGENEFYLLEALEIADEFNGEVPWKLLGSIQEDDFDPILDDYEILGYKTFVLFPDDLVGIIED